LVFGHFLEAGKDVNIYLIIILTILIGKYILDTTVEILNVKHVRTALPEEFKGYYDADKYQKAQAYLKEKVKFGLIEDTVISSFTVIFILIGGFNFIDTLARDVYAGTEIITGLIFLAMLMLVWQVISIPFSVYETFVIEAKFGFNKTTPKTFILDIIKSWVLGAVIGAIAFSAVIWFFLKTGKFAWVYCWAALTLFELFLLFIAPVFIMPLFNKFVPLEEGDLKGAIENYAQSQDFKMQGVFKIDASRRSTKSNAFFTGFGRTRRIALFDTLINKHTTDELVSVLAHEIGHYKKKHIIKEIAISIVITGLMFYILSFFLKNEGLFAAFKMENISIYASLIFFGFLYTPLNMFFSILGNILSRKYEYEADAYAVLTHKKPEAFIVALKKLTVDNLSNLMPHPLKVFLHYSHPPVLERIKAIKSL